MVVTSIQQMQRATDEKGERLDSTVSLKGSYLGHAQIYSRTASPPVPPLRKSVFSTMTELCNSIPFEEA